jgi:uncharacterized protein (DUF302 family)
MLVYENEDRNVKIVYNDPRFIAERHGITEKDELFSKIENALRSIATDGKGSSSDNG